MRDDDFYNPYESEYLRERESKYKVNNLVFVGKERVKEEPWCPKCTIHERRMILQNKSWCCTECGRSFPVEKIKEARKDKLLQKPQTQTSSELFVKSLGKKNTKPRFDSVNNELDDDTKKELRDMGYRI